MEAATPRGLARALDPGLSMAKEAAKALPSGKRPSQWKSTYFINPNPKIILKCYSLKGALSGSFFKHFDEWFLMLYDPLI